MSYESVAGKIGHIDFDEAGTGNGQFYVPHQFSTLLVDEARLTNRKSLWVRNFTLVELLTVIAIMMILMSVLLPSLKKCRDSANSSVCFGNLKQIGYIYAMYSADFDGWCASIWGGSDTCSPSFWYDNTTLMEYIGWNSSWSIYDSTKGPLRIRLCPSDLSPWNLGTSYKIGSYGGNEFLGSSASFTGISNTSKKKITNFLTPSKTLNFGDGTHLVIGPCYKYSCRHNSNMNNVYLDGHCGKIRMSNIPTSLHDVFWGY